MCSKPEADKGVRDLHRKQPVFKDKKNSSTCGKKYACYWVVLNVSSVCQDIGLVRKKTVTGVVQYYTNCLV